MKSEVKIKSKSGKLIELLLFEATSTPQLTIIDSPGGFLESKEKAAEENKTLIEYCGKHQMNYLSIDYSNNGKHKDQPVNELRFSSRMKDLETAVDYATAKYHSSIILFILHKLSSTPEIHWHPTLNIRLSCTLATPDLG